MENVNPPCVPFIGIFQLDCKQLSHDIVSLSGQINFSKKRILATIVSNLFKHQTENGYDFAVDPGYPERSSVLTFQSCNKDYNERFYISEDNRLDKPMLHLPFLFRTRLVINLFWKAFSALPTRMEPEQKDYYKDLYNPVKVVLVVWSLLPAQWQSRVTAVWAKAAFCLVLSTRPLILTMWPRLGCTLTCLFLTC